MFRKSAVFLLILLFGIVTTSYSLTWQDSVTAGADYLLQFQNNDGGFPWKVTNPDPNTYDPNNQSPPNTLGATARGLVASYSLTGENRFLVAANDIAGLIENRYDNNISIGSYGPPFFNKDIEFAYELADAGGLNITSKADDSAKNYFNSKLADYGSNTSIDTAAKAVYQRYIDSGWASPGAQMWMLGNWVHVGSLLNSTEIYSGYDGSDFAAELYNLMEQNTGSGKYFDFTSDIYSTLGLYGVLEGAYFGTGSTGTTGALTEMKQRLQDPGSYFSFQDLGYTTYLLGLLNDPAAGVGSKILMDWQNSDGAWIYSSGNWYGEGQGEVLLGLANNQPVPEPTTWLLFGTGLLGLLGLGRKKFLKKT